MPSADFCLLTLSVAIQGAAGWAMSRCLFRVSIEDSYPPTANGYVGVLLCRVYPSRILLMSLLPHGKQISQDKDVNFPCTTAAFTLPPKPVGFVVLCQLTQGLSLLLSLLGLWQDKCMPGFSQTRCSFSEDGLQTPHGDALAFGSYFWQYS